MDRRSRDVSRTLSPRLMIVVLGALLACAPADDPVSESLRPRPGLSPEEVVRIQLEALRHNDATDRGIAVAFRFASPDNRRRTGPLPRFARMIKSGPYAVMLDYRDAIFGPTEESEDHAELSVTLRSDHEIRQFVFVLTRRAYEPCLGCWMTDSVLIDEEEGRQVRRLSRGRRLSAS